MSIYIKVTGEDLEYLKEVAGKALSGEFGNIQELRIAVNLKDGVMVGANGRCTEYFGDIWDVDTTGLVNELPENQTPAKALS